MQNKSIKILAQNKKARHDYFIESTLECGMELLGTEVKSCRLGQINLKDSYVQVKNNELYLIGAHISPYNNGNIFNHDPFRNRRLLAHKYEIRKLYKEQQIIGMSLIPLSVYLKNGRIKCELAIAKGKKTYDKRQAIAQKDAEREMERKNKDMY